MRRRDFLAAGTATLLTSAMPVPAALAQTAANNRPGLAMPPVLDATEKGRVDLTAQYGSTAFFDGAVTRTMGYNQGYLGPVIRMAPGGLGARLHNELDVPVTVHWHGLLVPGAHDGGPHASISSGASWSADMQIDQPPATAFYHTHAHGRTASDVYAGLAGVIHVTDGRDDDRGLPSAYGVDDLTLVLQDRRFDARGRMTYDLSMMDVMHGFVGEVMVVNGQIDAIAAVPKGMTRLRLVNGSNARIYTLFMSDDRPMHLVATDGGFLDAPIALETLVLSPGERAELLVDFGDGRSVALMSGGDPNQGPMGMMGRMRGVIDRVVDRSFTVLDFAVDDTLPTRIETVPDTLDGTMPDLESANVRTRRVSLDMGMGPGGRMGSGMMGPGRMGRGMMEGEGFRGPMMSGMGVFGINGRPYDMDRIDFEVGLGTVERWIVESPMLAHPFHIHGTMFQVIREDGRAPRPEHRGWKDTVLVTGEIELLARFDQPAPADFPFMFHCHILEHEDRGMMGQMTVS
ncbi:MAG: multicopper oxidase domain-containing protein [Roseitalea sp.]|jgi:FtsP/CotA-like multicopper oxidase with cupredoxin domain|nr:multicopper oxidase domain-containing protein [Roseitalea sp.]MBO6721182.1 multicopper oxidase domain-containing protein [Roseitalea sp.]MBO6744240.1 multicopper oxidase domain-containing protein [Roseitalea sp.]